MSRRKESSQLVLAESPNMKTDYLQEDYVQIISGELNAIPRGPMNLRSVVKSWKNSRSFSQMQEYYPYISFQGETSEFLEDIEIVWSSDRDTIIFPEKITENVSSEYRHLLDQDPDLHQFHSLLVEYVAQYFSLCETRPVSFNFEVLILPGEKNFTPIPQLLLYFSRDGHINSSVIERDLYEGFRKFLLKKIPDKSTYIKLRKIQNTTGIFVRWQ